METTTEPMATEHTNEAINANSTDANAKRKSVSFVDEKLILDALNSTSNDAAAGKPHFDRSTIDKPNGISAKHHPNGRNGSVPFSNGKRYSNGATNGHSKSGYHKSTNGTTNCSAVAKNNAVIVYYNDPKATEINVDQLLTKPVAESAKMANGHNNKTNYVPKGGGHSNGYRDHQREGQQYQQNGKHVAIGAKASNGNGHHPVKFADNWRTKGLRMDQPQYQPMKASANGHNNGHSGKPNGRSFHPHTKTPNGKTNGTFVKPAPKQSEPITIYYTTPECSEVIEQNLKQLQLKGANDSNSEKPTNDAVCTAGDTQATPSSATADSSALESSPPSSQENVINISQSREMEATVPPPPIAPNGDQYDVINGGVPIEAPVLPTEGEKHSVRCTLVSHPGHFYFKFVNPAHDAVLANMNEFYNNDEHIDLSVDVLKAGQYFAACRLKPPTEAKEWIRVQLQSVECPELINCLLIDEGCFGIFKIADLQPLYNQFRSVPKQAIRASLSGVIPKEIDWLPQQSLDFNKLVSDQLFHTGEQKFDQKSYEEKQSMQIELYFTDGELANKSVADIAVERDIASKK